MQPTMPNVYMCCYVHVVRAFSIHSIPYSYPIDTPFFPPSKTLLSLPLSLSSSLPSPLLSPPLFYPLLFSPPLFFLPSIPGNPIKNIRPEIISQGMESVFAVLRNRAPTSSTSSSSSSNIRDQPRGGEVIRKAPLKSKPMERSGWNDDSADTDRDRHLDQNQNQEEDRHSQGQGFRGEADPSRATRETLDRGGRDRHLVPVPVDRGGEGPRGDSRHGSYTSDSGRITHNPHAQIPTRSDSRPDPRSDPRVREIERLEREMAECSSSVKKMQIRRDITALKSQIGGR